MDENIESQLRQALIDAQLKCQKGDLLGANTIVRQLKTQILTLDCDEQLQSDIYFLNFETSWALNGDPSCFTDGVKAAELSIELQRKCIIYHNLGTYALQKNLLEVASSFIASCLKFATNDVDKAAPLKLKGRLLFLKGELDNALEAYAQAAYYAETFNQDALQIYIILGITDVFIAQKLYQTAISELTHAEQIAKRVRNLVLYIRCAVRKSQVLIMAEDEKTAIEVIKAIPQQFD